MTEIIEVNYDKQNIPSTDEPVYHVNAGNKRRYPCVSVCNRRRNGEPKKTYYTVSKNGKYREYYEAIYAEYIVPYYGRRSQTVGGDNVARVAVDAVDGGRGEAWAGRGGEYRYSFAASTVAG